MRNGRALSRLEDILDSIAAIKAYVKGVSLPSFRKNRMMVDAVLRNIEIIGEAARGIPQAVRKVHPEIPWKRIIGLRNIVIHQYANVDLDTIWKIIKVNLPKIEPALREITSGMEEE
ncbi:MAG: DUF86 domain-containing protein [Euryarchaeota archaeon]|nr:DUF86 domain-containing protein [Euryarchaeota archaeon]